MREFLKSIVREVEGSRTTVYELRVGEGDLGKVIGKAGQTAKNDPDPARGYGSSSRQARGPGDIRVVGTRR